MCCAAPLGRAVGEVSRPFLALSLEQGSAKALVTPIQPRHQSPPRLEPTVAGTAAGMRLESQHAEIVAEEPDSATIRPN